ncbi:MAG: hypothetical protein KUG77_29270 [Nannocystaceae bacterium]|nr:hypothetical protein [Nannocystaceae bacterium]
MVLLSVGLTGGCASADESSLAPAERSATPDELRSEETPRRGAVLGGERVRRVPQWPGDDEIEESVISMMPAGGRSAVDDLSLPGFVLRRREFASTTTVMLGHHWYATWAQHDGLIVTLNVSGEARVHPHVKPFEGNERVRGQAAFVTQNETIWSVTWVENGVAYDLGLECESPTMPQCQGAAFAMELAEDLAYVGPREDAR